MTRSTAVFCRYHFDPLDRLVAVAPIGEPAVLRFYQKTRLATEIQGAVQSTLFQHEDQLLAQQQGPATTLLACDAQRSVLHLLDSAESKANAYNPYGHAPADSGLTCLLGFNGERRDPVTGHYLLGNGYRAFNPVLMRFNSPDSLSPFGEGGLNAYGYCQGDPVNFRDPTGHAPTPFFMRSSPFIPRTTITAFVPRGRAATGLQRRNSIPTPPLSDRGAVASPIASTSSATANVMAPTSQSPGNVQGPIVSNPHVTKRLSRKEVRRHIIYLSRDSYKKYLNDTVPEGRVGQRSKLKILSEMVARSHALHDDYGRALASASRKSAITRLSKVQQKYGAMAQERQGLLNAFLGKVQNIRSPSDAITE